MSKWVFLWLLVLDGVLGVFITLLGQWLTLGFDPTVYNPIFVGLLALVFTIIESYLPFLILYSLVFGMIAKKFPGLSRTRVAVGLFAALLVISLTLEFLSFGPSSNAVTILVPIVLAMINVGGFYLVRIRWPRVVEGR